MTRFAANRILVFAIAIFLLGREGAQGQATSSREIVIRYRAGQGALPAPHREGNTYVIAIPRTLGPAPEKLAAPFANDVEGNNEVWRFEISDNTQVKVAELDQGTVRVRLEDGASRVDRRDSPPKEVPPPLPE